ncbi:proline dehydrogenase family protein [Kineococcus radiotolerans]|uniref:proline dehydrogenase n=1 Tax=Kineococcus radiotolerans (strain ATCC BAA-149 / DSM 14245 / SRS30216) TaxID=266940 RepID=A6WGK3_KINRD|nr:proline dehydrogenase family protein [Kineococcus radiotolerans]ABS05942.1 Proline dehydrogenase [Kineococcus radiotolerans SRS30216 = ATCC BAA-149]
MFGQLLLGVAGNRGVRSLVTGSSLSRPVVARFVAGDDVDAATAAVRTLTGDGIAATLDRLGEDVTEEAQADETVAGYRDLVERLAAEGLAAGNEISIKLSALGQGLGRSGPQRATERAHDLAAHAREHGVDVTVDMEDHTRVDDTLTTVAALRADFPRTGCVLQAMLRRTEGDARDLAVAGSRVRLVKGAYNEPPEVAYPAKADVDKAYVRCLRTLLDGGAYPMIATHDLRIVNLAEELLRGRDAGTAEFQMLYGIRAPEQQRLARAGHVVRVYVPYGTDWYGYFSRRLAERPANLAFFARSLVAG